MVVQYSTSGTVILEPYNVPCDQAKLHTVVEGLNNLSVLYDTAKTIDDGNQLTFYSNAYVAR